MRNTNQRERDFRVRSTDFCKRKREIERWEIPGRSGEREREGTLAREGQRRGNYDGRPVSTGGDGGWGLDGERRREREIGYRGWREGTGGGEGKYSR